MTSPASGPHPQALPMRLELRQVSCFFATTEVVHAVDLTVAPGEHVAIIGGNGSGKTTLLRAIMGLHQNWSGTIHADGTACAPNPTTPHPRMVWMPQRQPRGQFPFTVRELISPGPGSPCPSEIVCSLGLETLVHRPLAALSGGQLQRAFLARAVAALAQGSTLLLADEPTAALDFDGQEHVALLLAGLQQTLLVVTHDLTLARTCHRVLQMAQGQMREISL